MLLIAQDTASDIVTFSLVIAAKCKHLMILILIHIWTNCISSILNKSTNNPSIDPVCKNNALKLKQV